MIVSLYYSLHNDTPPKPNRGDTPSLLSNNRCSRAFKIQCNNITHLLTKSRKIRRDRLLCDFQKDGRYKHVTHNKRVKRDVSLPSLKLILFFSTRSKRVLKIWSVSNSIINSKKDERTNTSLHSLESDTTSHNSVIFWWIRVL